jgi:predicted dehydrogenase
MGSIDHITTLYDYGDSGPRHVVAEGAWVTARGFPFRMRYTVEFEHAVADWDLMRPDQLLLVRDGKAEPTPLPAESAYDREVAHFVQAIATGGPTRATLADAAAVTALLEAEKRSLDAQRSIAAG